MNISLDPYESYLQRADQLFQAGEVVQAGQIWQAILKRVPGHERAQAGLYQVKLHFDARATQDGLGDAPPKENPRDTATGLPQAPAKALLAPPNPSDLSRALDRGCALYDAGQVEDALRIWEEILEQDPGNNLANGYLQQARRILAQAPAPAAAPAPIPAPAEAPETEKLLREGCTLYDMGEVEGALAKWERALALDSAHVLARQYVNDARRELGRPPLDMEAAPPSLDVPAEATTQGNEDKGEDTLARIVKEGVQLYDMGMAEEAIERWKQVLEADPQHTEAQGYIEMAANESRQALLPRPSPEPKQPQLDPLAPLFSDARELVQRQQFAEAGDVFQQILQCRPEDAQALQGYQQARTLAAAQSLPPQAAPPPPEEIQAPASVIPPAAIEREPAPSRKGLSINNLLRKGSLPPWALSPKVLITTIGVFFALIIISYIVHSFRQDRALAAAVLSRRGEVLAPVQRSTQIPDLAESPAAIRKEAEGALGEDSLLAYFRTQELLRLNPGDASAGQLLERARGALSSTVSGSYSLPDFEKLVQIGDLDGADKLMDGLLRMDPDNPLLRERAGRVWLAKAQVYASKERWQDARDALRRGRAAFPQDKAWRGRLRLLEQIQAMNKAERVNWIQMLG